MPKLVSKKFEFRPVGRFGTQVHDWETILDGEARIYIQGEDFAGRPQNWAYQVKLQGCRRGLECVAQVMSEAQVKSEKLPEGTVAVAIQASAPADETREKELKDRWAAYQQQLRDGVKRRAAKVASNGDHEEAEDEESDEASE